MYTKTIQSQIYIYIILFSAFSCKTHNRLEKIPAKKYGNLYLRSIVAGKVIKIHNIIHDECYHQGGREHMEDRNCLIEGKKSFIAAVYDGHGGHAVSEFLKNKFTVKLFDKIKNSENQDLLKEIIIKLFKKTDKDLYKEKYFSGSTAVIVVLFQKKLIFINLGDSRAILIENGALVFHTKDHKPSNKEEKMRIKDSDGGFVIETDIANIWRVNTSYHHSVEEANSLQSGLSVSRAFGDNEYKGKKSARGMVYNDINPPVSVVPDIHICRLKPGKRYKVVMGSDGLWDNLTNKQITDLINDNISCRDMIGKAIEANGGVHSSDNVTVRTIRFDT